MCFRRQHHNAKKIDATRRDLIMQPLESGSPRTAEVSALGTKNSFGVERLKQFLFF